MKEPISPKCIWMEAGLVAYRLCDRQMECEECLFDQVFRGRISSMEQIAPGEHPKTLKGPRFLPNFDFDAHCFYGTNHLWCRVEEEGRLRVGIDDFGRKLVGQVLKVDTPSKGAVGNPDGDLRITNPLGEMVLSSPVAGNVVWRNGMLGLNPSLVENDPFGAGCFMVVEPSDLGGSLKGLRFGRAAETWLRQEVEALAAEVVTIAFDQQPSVGTTATDGGELVQDWLLELRCQERFRPILARFLGVGPNGKGAGKWLWR